MGHLKMLFERGSSVIEHSICEQLLNVLTGLLCSTETFKFRILRDEMNSPKPLILKSRHAAPIRSSTALPTMVREHDSSREEARTISDPSHLIGFQVLHGMHKNPSRRVKVVAGGQEGATRSSKQGCCPAEQNPVASGWQRRGPEDMIRVLGLVPPLIAGGDQYQYHRIVQFL